MKQIVFFGAPDKSHLLLILGKLLAIQGQRVLLVDSTITQSVRGYLPISDDRPIAFVTEFEGIDIASGFLTRRQLEQYVKHHQGHLSDYDVILLDTDHTEFVKGMDLPEFTHRVWCYNLDKLMLQKNTELMKRLYLYEVSKQPLSFFRLLYPYVESTIKPLDLDAWLAGYSIHWTEPRFYIPFDDRDISTKVDNQHHARIHVKRLSPAYTKTVIGLARVLFDWDDKKIRTSWKRMRKGEQRGL